MNMIDDDIQVYVILHAKIDDEEFLEYIDIGESRRVY